MTNMELVKRFAKGMFRKVLVQGWDNEGRWRSTVQCRAALMVQHNTRSSMFGVELRWPGDSQRESGRLARIDSHESIRRKKPMFS